MKKKSKSRLSYKLIGAALVAALATGTAAWTLKSGGKILSLPVPVYSAASVTDGDTFITPQKQIVRLLGIDAPELDRCGGMEAKEELEKIVSKQPLYIVVSFKDANRLIGDVYIISGSVTEKLLASGWVHYQGAVDRPEWKAASDKAKAAGIGIYSSKCTQETNPVKPNCVIKGNNRNESPASYYRFPGCRQYAATQVQLYLGDQWFCTEKEAKTAGYIKGPDCLGKTWP